MNKKTKHRQRTIFIWLKIIEFICLLIYGYVSAHIMAWVYSSPARRHFLMEWREPEWIALGNIEDYLWAFLLGIAWLLIIVAILIFIVMAIYGIIKLNLWLTEKISRIKGDQP